MENNCWLVNECNQRDCNTFCMRKYKLDYLYKEANISESQRKRIALSVDEYPETSDLDAFLYLQSIEQNILDFVKEGNNLYLHSTRCGNGKTSWALKLAQAYLNKIWVKSGLECRVLFINIPRYLSALKENISQKSEYVQHIKDNVLKADIVIWDEVGSKGLTLFEHENMLSAINARIDLNKTNIYTSNLTMRDLNITVGPRLFSRITGLSHCIELKGLDKRGLNNT